MDVLSLLGLTVAPIEVRADGPLPVSLQYIGRPTSQFWWRKHARLLDMLHRILQSIDPLRLRVSSSKRALRELTVVVAVSAATPEECLST
jgi:hypothetical protein